MDLEAVAADWRAIAFMMLLLMFCDRFLFFRRRGTRQQPPLWDFQFFAKILPVDRVQEKQGTNSTLKLKSTAAGTVLVSWTLARK